VGGGEKNMTINEKPLLANNRSYERRTVLIDFMDQLDCAKGCPD
jgi:hypothetical protein